MPRGGGRGGGGGGGRGGGEGGRGRKKNHKGLRRMFTDEESLREQAVKDEKAKAWRRQCGIESSDEEVEEGAEGAEAGAKNRDLPPTGSSSEEESSEEEEVKPCGVSHLIEVQNPNRAGNRTAKKISELETSGSTTLSRREREELEKQEAKRKYQALHAAGKTDEAQADLARLAIIRKQRAEAAKKRDEEKLQADAAAKKS